MDECKTLHLGVALSERDFAPYLAALRADVNAHVLRGNGNGTACQIMSVPSSSPF